MANDANSRGVFKRAPEWGPMPGGSATPTVSAGC
jgi:hypothetical protein